MGSKALNEYNWKYETCKCCTREQRIAWWTSDKLWTKVVITYYRDKVLCLECFLRMADDRLVSINIGDIKIEGLVSRDG